MRQEEPTAMVVGRSVSHISSGNRCREPAELTARECQIPQLATRIEGPAIVIGDLHGRDEPFARLLTRLQELPDFNKRSIVLMGDLVDRGPNPKGLLELVVNLIDSHPMTTVVCGNHELEMSRALGWMPSPGGSSSGPAWLRGYGSETTFASYGADFGNLDDLCRRIPERHRDLISGLPWCVEHPQYLFVHAGLDPHLPYDVQLKILRQRAQTSGRISWLCSRRLAEADPPRDCRKCVVSGHVLVPEVVSRKRRLLVGTTDGIEGYVSAVLLPERRVITAPRGGEASAA